MGEDAVKLAQEIVDLDAQLPPMVDRSPEREESIILARAFLKERERAEKWKAVAAAFDEAHGTGLKTLYGSARDNFRLLMESETVVGFKAFRFSELPPRTSTDPIAEGKNG